MFYAARTVRGKGETVYVEDNILVSSQGMR